MSFVSVVKAEGMATVRLSRGKVNALNEAVVEELRQCFEALEADSEVRAVALTGAGKFFSFGFDIPEFLSYSKQEFTRFLQSFSGLCTYLFAFPKPVVAGVNGHAVAGGCMVATACDYRLMAEGKAKIGLNEITFGASVFDWSVEMLRCCTGQRNAERILTSGALYSAGEARGLGLVDECCAEEAFPGTLERVGRELAQKDSQAFREIKRLLRGPMAAGMREREAGSIREFVELWYTAETWEKLQGIKIHS